MTKDSFTWCSMSLRSFLIAFSALFLLVGCTGGEFPPPARLSLDPYISGNNQAGLQGELLAKPFVVLVEGPQEPGLLGGKGSRRVLPRVKVQFSVLNPESGAQFESESEKRHRCSPKQTQGEPRRHNYAWDTPVVTSGYKRLYQTPPK